MLKARLAVVVLAGLVSACAPPIREQAPAEKRSPADFPEAYYREAAAQGKPVFRVDPVASLVVIEVRRAGSLARLGHDHVVASHDVEGYVASEDGRADFYVQLERLVVDEPALRAEAGFDTQPSEADIAGTRGNMLERVLEAGEFPFALIHVSGVEARERGVRLTVAITLHGTTRMLQVPAQIETDAGEMSVTGRLAFDQTDFGISPFSILGGAIQVQNRVDLRFKIRARRIG
jgi:hypothetical protein